MRMPALVCFGPFELDIEAAEVRTDGPSLRLPEQQFQILHMLLLAQGGVVSRRTSESVSGPTTQWWNSTAASMPPS